MYNAYKETHLHQQ